MSAFSSSEDDTASRLLDTALKHFEAAQWDATERCCRSVLEVAPGHGDALHLLGLSALKRGQPQSAISFFLDALVGDDQNVILLTHLGMAHRATGDWQSAGRSYHRAAQSSSHDAESLHRLGDEFYSLGMLDSAIACYRRALALRSDHCAALNSWGNALRLQGSFAEAAGKYREVIHLSPELAAAHSNLGMVLHALGQLEDASECQRRAIALDPTVAEFHNSLGLALKDLGHLDDAVDCYRHALELRPAFPEARTNLGVALANLGLGDEGLVCLREAIREDPRNHLAHSNLLFLRIFFPGDDPLTVLEEHAAWQRQHADPVAARTEPFPNDRSPGRRLRVGYVSANFRNHCQSHFTIPLLSSHDHEQLEIYCYSDVTRPDPLTQRLRGYADGWRETSSLGDERLARLIRDDRIDILVDLTMHMAQNRALVFARKPAPVQACWLAYPGTTGLKAMDYRLSDSFLDPPGLNDHLYTERTIRLPDSFWCYDPLCGDSPAVNELPALRCGQITFGCLNHSIKVNPMVLGLWARVLNAVVDSRLILLMGEDSHRVRTRNILTQAGVSPERVQFISRQPREDYLRLYRRIDIALDTVPSNGHTTSLDSLWMGVPVVTLVGDTVSGRAGYCQSMNLGCPELIAFDSDTYVQIAADLARDLRRLAELRGTLSDRLRASPLMNAKRFTRHVESAFREMWAQWCGAGSIERF